MVYLSGDHTAFSIKICAEVRQPTLVLFAERHQKHEITVFDLGQVNRYFDGDRPYRIAGNLQIDRSIERADVSGLFKGNRWNDEFGGG